MDQMMEPEAGASQLPVPPQSGDPAVDEASRALALVMHEPLELQVQEYERAHRTLQDRLADVES